MGLEPTSLFQCITFALMHAGAEDDEEMNFEVSTCGELIRAKLHNSAGDVVMCAIGNSYDNLGEQFALGCLKNVSFDRLRALHKTPLRGPRTALKRVK